MAGSSGTVFTHSVILAISVGGAVVIGVVASITFIFISSKRGKGFCADWTRPDYRIPQYVNASCGDVFADPMMPRPRNTNRLTKTKRQFSLSDSFPHPLVSMPPILPPLPSRRSTFSLFSSFGGSREPSLKRKSSWIDEDAIHGPRVRNGRPGRRFSIRESWPIRTPTLPRLSPDKESPSNTFYTHTNSPISTSPTGPLARGMPLSRSGSLNTSVVTHPVRYDEDPGADFGNHDVTVHIPNHLWQSISVPQAYPHQYQQHPLPAPSRPPLPVVAPPPNQRSLCVSRQRPSVADSGLASILESTAQRLQEGRGSTRRRPHGSARRVSRVSTTASGSPVKGVGMILPAGSIRTISVERKSQSPRSLNGGTFPDRNWKDELVGNYETGMEFGRGFDDRDRVFVRSPRREVAIVEVKQQVVEVTLDDHGRPNGADGKRERSDSAASDLSSSSALSTVGEENDNAPPETMSQAGEPRSYGSTIGQDHGRGCDPFVMMPLNVPPPGTMDSPTIRPVFCRRPLDSNPPPQMPPPSRQLPPRPKMPLDHISGNAKHSSQQSRGSGGHTITSYHRPYTFSPTSAQSSPSGRREADEARDDVPSRPTVMLTSPEGDGYCMRLSASTTSSSSSTDLGARSSATIASHASHRRSIMTPPEKFRASEVLKGSSTVFLTRTGDDSDSDVSSFSLTHKEASLRPLPLRPQRRRSIRANENWSPTQPGRRLHLGTHNTNLGGAAPSGSPLRNVSTASSDSSTSSNYDDGASYSSSVYSTATAVTGQLSSSAHSGPISQGQTLKPLPGIDLQSQRLRARDSHEDKHGSPSSLHATVGELRRMNSQVSTVSSVASTGRESPTLSNLRGGGFSPSHQNSVVTGSKNYLGMAASSPSSSPLRDARDNNRSPCDGTPKSHSRNNSKCTASASANGKPVHSFDNAVVELRIPVIDIEAELAVAQRNKEHNKRSFRQNEEIDCDADRGHVSDLPNMVPVSLSGTMRAKGARGGVWDDAQSVESLGLYDQDGFLLSSPVREPEGSANEGTFGRHTKLRG